LRRRDHAVLDQIDQIEHLRLNGDRLDASAQLAPGDIKHMIVEQKLHVWTLGNRRQAINQGSLNGKSRHRQSLRPAATS